MSNNMERPRQTGVEPKSDHALAFGLSSRHGFASPGNLGKKLPVHGKRRDLPV